MTVGPWRPIRFHAYDIRIAEVWANAIVSEKLEPRLDLSFELAGDEFAGTVQVSLRGPSKVSVKELEAKDLLPMPSATKDELWYPVGYGRQIDF